jgi:hypothetical protein
MGGKRMKANLIYKGLIFGHFESHEINVACRDDVKVIMSTLMIYKNSRQQCIDVTLSNSKMSIPRYDWFTSEETDGCDVFERFQVYELVGIDFYEEQ